VPAQEPEDEVEEEDAIVEVTRRPARRGYPEPSFEGLEALRAAPKDYHELAASLASAGASIEGGDRPLLDFRRDLITSARVAAVTTVWKSTSALGAPDILPHRSRSRSTTRSATATSRSMRKEISPHRRPRALSIDWPGQGVCLQITKSVVTLEVITTVLSRKEIRRELARLAGVSGGGP
jgi:hypothetical protein